jgi:hypothetical protein
MYIAEAEQILAELKVAKSSNETYPFEINSVFYSDLLSLNVAIARYESFITALSQKIAWQEASLAVAKGQAYSLSTPSGSQTVTRADAKHIHEMLQYWKQQAQTLDPELNPNNQPTKKYSLVNFSSR